LFDFPFFSSSRENGLHCASEQIGLQTKIIQFEQEKNISIKIKFISVHDSLVANYVTVHHSQQGGRASPLTHSLMDPKLKGGPPHGPKIEGGTTSWTPLNRLGWCIIIKRF
jgi:hypothetical protein